MFWTEYLTRFNNYFAVGKKDGVLLYGDSTIQKK